MQAAIETEALTRRFGRNVAVDDLYLSIPEQAVYGFLGRNGAGKTTTLKMILGLLKPSSGRVRLFGTDVARNRIAAVAQAGALLEAHGFYSNLSGRENLDLTRILLRLPSSEIDRVLEKVEMTEHGARRVGDYSLGMRQRLGIARAMLGAPPLLVLDEPTNGLDPDGIADMRRFLRDLPERTGTTVLVSSHLLGEIEQISTHVGILSHGRLVLEGKLASLKADIAPELWLQTDQPDQSARIAMALGLDVTMASDGLNLTVKPEYPIGEVTAELNRRLVEASISVFALTPRPRSLEAIYHAVASPAGIGAKTTPDVTDHGRTA